MLVLCVAPGIQAQYLSIKRDTFLNQYIQKEMIFKTGRLSEEKEIFLNTHDVLDEEILNIDSQFLQTIDGVGIDKIRILTQYMSFYETPEGSIQSYSLNESEKEELLYNLGSKSVNVDENDNYSDNDDKATYLKRTMIIAEVVKDNQTKLACSFYCRWLTEPSDRLIDIVTLSWKSHEGSFDFREPYGAHYTAIRTETWWDRDPETGEYEQKTESESHLTDLTDVMTNEIEQTGLCVKFDMYDNYGETVGFTYHESVFSNHQVYMHFYLSHFNVDSIHFYSKYYQQFSSGGFTIDSIDVSFSLISGDVSLSISGGYEVDQYYRTVDIPYLGLYEFSS